MANPEVKEKVDFLERRYGEIAPEVEMLGNNKSIVRFNLQIDKEKAERTEKELIFFSHKPHGFSCIVDLDAEKVEEIFGWHFEEAMILDVALTNSEVRSKIESLKERYGNISVVYATSPDKPNRVELRFTESDPHEESGELYGILCIVDMETKKVMKIEEFSVPPVSVPTSP